MDAVLNILYFIIAISVLVFVHEFGHFIAARLSGMRVDVFALGMGYRVLGWNRKRGFSFGKLPDDFDGEGHTDYRLALFPVGGYVKIVGMVDESMDTDFIEKAPEPWEFRSKNPFQKAITITAGVIMNFLFAFAIFSFIIQIQGKDFWDTTTIGSVSENSIASEIGFVAGDRIIEINDKKIDSWAQLWMAISIDDLGEAREIKLIRNDNELVIHADGNKIIRDITNKKDIGLYPENLRTILNSVQTLKPAGKLGLMVGDTIIAVNGIQIGPSTEFQKAISGKKNTTVFLEWKRDTRFMSDSITPTSDGIIGVGISNAYSGTVIHKDYGIFESIELGWNETLDKMNLIVGSLAQMISGNVSVKQSVGGPIAIAKWASREAEQGFMQFLGFMALLSVMFAVINIAPFPALDGGHLVFIIIEAVARREVPIKIKMAIQNVGMMILLLFMAFTIYIDITR